MGAGSDWIKRRTTEKVRGALSGFLGQNTSGNCDCKIAQINADRTSVNLPDGSSADVATIGQPGSFATYCSIHNNTGTLVVDEPIQYTLDGGKSVSFWSIQAATYLQLDTLYLQPPTNDVADVALYVTNSNTLSQIDIYTLDPVLLNQITSTIGYSRINVNVDAFIDGNVEYSLVAKLPSAATCGNHVYLAWGQIQMHETYDVIVDVNFYWMILKDVVLDKEKMIFTSKTVKTGNFNVARDLSVPVPPKPTWDEAITYPAVGGGFFFTTSPTINVTLNFERSPDFPIFLGQSWTEYVIRLQEMLCGTNDKQEPVMDLLFSAQAGVFTHEIIRITSEVVEGDNGIDCLTTPDFLGSSTFHNNLIAQGFIPISNTFTSECTFTYGPPWKPEGFQPAIFPGFVLTDRYGSRIELTTTYPVLGPTNTWSSGNIFYNWDEPILPTNIETNNGTGFITPSIFGDLDSRCYVNACMQDSSDGFVFREALFRDSYFNQLIAPASFMNLTASRSVRSSLLSWDFSVAYDLNDSMGNFDDTIEPNTLVMSIASWMIDASWAKDYYDAIILANDPRISPQHYEYGECQNLNVSPLKINQLSSQLGYPELKFTKFYQNYVPAGINPAQPTEVLGEFSCFPYHYDNEFGFTLAGLTPFGINTSQTAVVQTQTGVLNYQFTSGGFNTGNIPTVIVEGGAGAPSNHYHQTGQSTRFFSIIATDLGGDSNIEVSFPAKKGITDWFQTYGPLLGQVDNVSQTYLNGSGYLKDGKRCLNRVQLATYNVGSGDSGAKIFLDLNEYGAATVSLDPLPLDAYEQAHGFNSGFGFAGVLPLICSSSQVVGFSVATAYARSLIATDQNLRQFVSDPALDSPDDASADPDHVYLARMLIYDEDIWGIVKVERDYTDEPLGAITSMRLLFVQLDETQEGEAQYQVINSVSFNLQQLPVEIAELGRGDFVFGMETFIGSHIVV